MDFSTSRYFYWGNFILFSLSLWHSLISRILLCLLPDRIQDARMSLFTFDVSESQCSNDSQSTSSVFPVSMCCFCSYYQCVVMSGFPKDLVQKETAFCSPPLLSRAKGKNLRCHKLLAWDFGMSSS